MKASKICMLLLFLFTSLLFVQKTGAQTGNRNLAGKDNSSQDSVVDFKALNYKLIPILIKAVQEQQVKIDELTQLVYTLQEFSLSPNSQNVNIVSVNSASLEQNVPNPLTKNTSIEYILPVDVHYAQLVFTDVNGVIVKQVALNGSGKGVVHVTTSTLNSGTYSYTLVIDGKKTDTKKMIVAK